MATWSERYSLVLSLQEESVEKRKRIAIENTIFCMASVFAGNKILLKNLENFGQFETLTKK